MTLAPFFGSSRNLGKLWSGRFEVVRTILFGWVHMCILFTSFCIPKKQESLRQGANFKFDDFSNPWGFTGWSNWVCFALQDRGTVKRSAHDFLCMAGRYGESWWFYWSILATYWYSRKSHQAFWPIADLIATIVPPGLFFGRIANFINGELWGRKTDFAWGVLFPQAPDFALGIARHPSQIYAALLEGLLVFIFVQFRFWKSNICQKTPGRLGGEFLTAYALARIIGEFFREPDASLIIGMSRGQFYSIFLLIGGFFVILIAEKRNSQS